MSHYACKMGCDGCMEKEISIPCVFLLIDDISICSTTTSNTLTCAIYTSPTLPSFHGHNNKEWVEKGLEQSPKPLYLKSMGTIMFDIQDRAMSSGCSRMLLLNYN